jgi:signal transduction histidine kinase/CheY-like chemotaxis protein
MSDATTQLPRLLLVDDDEADRMAVRQALKQVHFPCVVKECESAAALARHSGEFECVLLDYLIPGTTALELLPELKRRLPGAAVVVLTGHGDEQVAVELMKAGAADYLSKDRLDGRILAKVLHHALALQAARNRLERADRARIIYAGKLRELVEAAPVFYRGVRLDERFGAATRVACKLLDGTEAFIELRGGANTTSALARGEEVTSPKENEIDPRWRRCFDLPATANGAFAIETLAWEEGSNEVVLRYALRDGESGGTGFLGVRCAPPPAELADVMGSLLAQIGQTVLASVENLRLYQAARKAVASRDTVMAVVSHDLRSPLSAIALGLEILSEESTSAETATVLERMERSRRHMKRLIDDLLDVAQIDSGNFRVVAQTESVDAILDDARQLVAPLAEQAGVRLLVSAPHALEVQAHRHRIVQVLSNLLGNAVKFAPRGGTIDLSVERTPGELHFRVKDDGPGIDAELLERIFERYWRKEGRGLGLGLFIAQAIVVAHGGRIWAESTVGQGATITFALPHES